MLEKDIIIGLVEDRAACVMDYDLLEYHTGRIIPLADRIAALEGSRGMDGREIQLINNFFPVIIGADGNPSTTQVEGQEPAIIWRLHPRNESDPQDWNLLVFLSELTGPEGPAGDQGPEGPAGHDGSGVMIRGTVPTSGALTGLSGVEVGHCYVALDTHHVWICKTLPSSSMSSWEDMGTMTGVKGDRGDRGPQGPQGSRGPKGSSGGISSFLLSWVVSTATNAAITGVMLEVNDMVNDAINDAIMELTNTMQDVAQSAIDKTIEEMMDEFKGEKGEKGDKGDDGKDGKSGAACVIKGHKDTEFELFPITGKAGDAWLVGEENNLYVWVPNVVAEVDIGKWENVGKVVGPKGNDGLDAQWRIQLLDDKDGLVDTIIQIKPTEDDAPNMYVKGGDGILVKKSLGVVSGFSINTKYPIPKLIPTTSSLPSTADKFLTNNGEKLEWVDIAIDDEPKESIKLKSPDNKIWNITVSNDGRLNVTAEVA